MAKTHLSLSHDPALINVPSGFTLPVRELRPLTGAGWIVAMCGDMQTMPGLPAESPPGGSTSTPTDASSACADPCPVASAAALRRITQRHSASTLMAHRDGRARLIA